MPTSDRLSFVLRQYLPPHTFDLRLEELIVICREAGIEEILFYPHGIGLYDSPSGFWRDDEIERDGQLLARAKERLSQVGIRMGVNIWNTIGHGDRGRVYDSAFPFQRLVSASGSVSQTNPCPLCPSWRAYYRRCVESYARVEPCAIFLDDDFRWQNHPQTGDPGQFNCFCPLHLDSFNEKHHTNFGSDALIAEIVRPGTPSPARGQWLELLNAQFLDLASEIERTVHAISPQTEIGLMSSSADQMRREGRAWPELLRALAGPKGRLLYRPCYPSYSELPARELPEALAFYRQIFAELPPETVTYAEIDNCMPTEFNQSPAHLALRMALAALCGTRHFHISLFDWNGNGDTFTGSREYAKILPGLQNSISSILRDFHGTPIAHGIQLPLNRQAVLARETKEGKSLEELVVDSLAWAKPLQLAGFPITFDSSPIVALTEESVTGLDSEELRTLLGKTVLLEATAARLLTDRGSGHWIGLAHFEELAPEIDRVVSEEVISADDPYALTRFDHKPLGPVSPESRWVLAEKAVEVTRLLGRGKATYATGEYTFETEWDGKILGFPLFPAGLASNGFLTRYRVERLRRNLAERALKTETPFSFVDGQPHVLPLHLQFGPRHLLACVNLRTQTTSRLCFHCFHTPVISRAYLWHENRVCSIEFEIHSMNLHENSYTVEIQAPIPHLGICILTTEYKGSPSTQFPSDR